MLEPGSVVAGRYHVEPNSDRRLVACCRSIHLAGNDRRPNLGQRLALNREWCLALGLCRVRSRTDAKAPSRIRDGCDDTGHLMDLRRSGLPAKPEAGSDKHDYKKESRQPCRR